MNSHPSILIACPISSHKDYVILKWAKQLIKIMNAYNGPCSALVVDNSSSPVHAKRVTRLTGGLPCHWVDTRFKNNYDAISISRNYIRRYFLLHDFDYLLSLECDIFPPTDTIAHLLSLKKDLAGFTYFLGSGNQSPLMVQENEEYGNIRETQNLSITGSIDFIDGSIKKVFSIGMGCLMIRRNVIEKIEFRTDPTKRLHDDSFFAEDCANNGFPIFCDTSVIPTHKNQPWNLLKNINL